MKRFSVFVQYFIGFSLWALSFFLSARAFVQLNILDIFISVFCGLLAFIFTKDFFLYPVAKMTERFFYSAGGDYHDELSHVESLITDHRYELAREELLQYIAENPESSLAYHRLVALLNDHLHESELALELAYKRLNAGKLAREDDKLIFLTVDILEELQQLPHAEQLLESVISKVADKMLRTSLQERLQIISEKISNAGLQV